jgi:uncharacterized protein DUF5658
VAWFLEPPPPEVALGQGVAAAGLLVLLNLVDGIFTHVFLQTGVARELNPLMRLAYEGSPSLFFGCKAVAVGIAAWVLGRHARTVRFARGALAGGLALYGGVCVLHVWLLVRWVGGGA